ncbi:tetratricopeptide repeat protein [Azospirillum thermophilum]|uniref:tetratricopeptide repeat protein n=1 Tax=Azospirillum thermophilum TaxID=2202148 RepID=UPI001FE2D49C|nr:tetratricopeptide repeat protein [Azospirillum thermophilum]
MPDPARVARWADRLAALGPGLRVGIGWRSQLITAERRGAYVALEALAPLFAVSGLTFVNLQYDDCEAELREAEDRFGVRIHRWADLDLMNDLEEAAALTANLDLVISPAMSAGELAGALGVPVWRFCGPDWTQLGTAVRPWFPSMRLFQPQPGEALEATIPRMARLLRETAGVAAPPPAAARQPPAPPPPSPPSPPADPEALLNEAVALHRLGRLEEAEAAYGAVLRAAPDHADALHLLGLLDHQAGRHEQAAARITEALRLAPDFPTAWNHLGLVRQAQERGAEAEDCFKRALALRPAFPEALTHLGLRRHMPGQLAEALVWHRRSILLAPDNQAAHTNIGHACEMLGRFPEATAHYRRALALRPDSPDAHNNLATLTNLEGRTEEVPRHLRRALRIEPGFPLAAWNLGLIELAEGRIAEGWAGYERRFSARQLQRARTIPRPKWQGEALNGRTLLVWSEQGVGDEILFASTIGDLAGLVDGPSGGRVIVECDRRLVPLFQRAFPWAMVRAEMVDAGGRETMVPPDCDLQIAAGSLPALLRDRLDRFPDRPAYLSPEPGRLALWRQRVAALGPGLKVGIAWRSQIVTARRKSAYTSIADWLPVIDLPGVVPVSLQYGDCRAELASVETGGRRLHRWDDLDLKDDFEGVAALISCLDLVIAPATAVGELAGALGAPTWRLCTIDWTCLGSAVRPWFPTMRPFAPSPAESMGDVVARVAAALSRLAGSAGPR